MKKLYSIVLIALGLYFVNPQSTQAQVTVQIQGLSNPALPAMLGYMNVFDLANNYQFGSGWALADIKTTEDAMECIVLQPNFNVWNAADPYWVQGGVGQKNMESNSYYEDNTLIGQNVTFIGNVTNATINPAYTVIAFIKVLDPALGFATTLFQSTPLTAAGPFSVMATIPNTPGLIVQYGYQVVGVNANPANEAALGNVTVCPETFLPLDLVDFNAAYQNNEVVLNWNTLDEENVKEFQIEKSLNGKLFTQTGTVAARNQNKNEYSFIDGDMNNNTLFYRLKMVDIDGQESYSNIERVEVEQTLPVKVYPNPAQDQISIVGTAQQIQHAELYNMTGQKMLTIRAASDLTTIDISNFPAGMYFLKLRDGQSTHFVKQ